MKLKHVALFSWFVLWRELSVLLLVLCLPFCCFAFYIMGKSIKQKLEQLPEILSGIRVAYDDLISQQFKQLHR